MNSFPSSPFFSSFKSIGRLALLCALFIQAPFILAAPLGGQVVGGSGEINQSGLQTSIQQNSSALALDWQSFNINNNEAVQFIQPDKNAIVLNRILGNSSSQIFGKLDANGQVILVNPNGLFFGDSAVVNVGGLLASGLDISPTDFLNGDYVFSALEGSEGAVINHGIIQAATGGSVSLLGRQVENAGFISAHLGAVNLVAAKEAVLSFDNDGLMGVKVNKAILQDELGVTPALLNAGNIQAEGGRVLLSASVSQDVFSQAVNNGGLQATSSVVMHKDGSFTLGAGADLVNSGTIDVSVSSGEKAGGQVVLLGENIKHSGEIHANAINAQAGSIELQARDTLLLIENSITSTRAELSGLGGGIKLLGANVGLFDETLVDASGANGGGSVFIGGDREGQNIQIPNSEFIFIGGKSNVYADALFNGNGGKVIAFAEDTARIYGNLFARGGEESGNGGFIETSGLKGFEIFTTPDTSANFGNGGVWLIDPNTITIVNADENNSVGRGDEFFNIESSTNNGAESFFSSGDGAKLDVDYILRGLQGSSTVIIKTTSSGVNSESGNINFTVGLDYDGVGMSTLKLEADDNIVFSSSVVIKDGDKSNDTFSIYLNAGGEIKLLEDTVINTQGGFFTVGNTTTPTTFTNLGTIDTSGPVEGVTINRTLKGIDGGAITINSQGSLTTGKLISTGGKAINQAGLTAGSITLDAGGDVYVNGSISAKGSAAERSGSSGFDGGVGGSVTLSANNIVNIASAIDVSGGNGVQRYNSSENGGNAGSIGIAGASILLGADLTAVGGAPDGGSYGNGGSITLTGPEAGTVTLKSGVVLDARGSVSDDIEINNAITASTHQAQSFTLKAKDITFGKNVGTSGVSLGDLNIVATGEVDATNSDIFVKSLNIDSDSTVTTGAISTQGTTDQNGGQVIINAQSVSVGGINTGGVNAGNIGINIEDNFAASGAITALTNASGNNGDISITGNNSSNSFTLDSVSGKTVEVYGNGGKDTFNLYGNVKGSDSAVVNGGAGEDTYNILAADIAADLDGGTGTDTLVGADQNNQWDISGNSSGTLYQTDTDKIMFSNIDALVGGSGDDAFKLTTSTAEIDSIVGGTGTDPGANSLQAANKENTWNITAENKGNVNGVSIFSNIQSLIGGTDVDVFNINAELSGSINGGKGADVFNLNALVSGSVLGGSGEDIFNIKNTDLVLLLDGEDGSDTLLVDHNAESIWEVTTVNGGTLVNSVDTKQVSFSNMENLHGGSGKDTFNLNANVTGEVLGLSGADEFNIKQDNLSLALKGGDGLDSLSGLNLQNTWTVDSSGNGSLKSSSATNTVMFSEIENINGGSDVDTFNLNADIGGAVTGNDGADVFNLNSYQTGTLYGNGGNDTFTVKKAGVSARLEGGAGVDSLLGLNVDNQWGITGDASGELSQAATSSSKILFSTMETLQGGSAGDAFTLTSSTARMANIIGGAGANSLQGADAINVWNITGSDAGDVTGVTSFSEIQTLVGGSQADTFNFNANINGSASGAGGADIFNLAITLSTSLYGNAGSDTFNILADGISQNINGGSGSDTLVGFIVNNQWNISGDGSGDLYQLATPSLKVKFVDIEALQGGSADDAFRLTVASASMASILGGGGANSLQGADIVNIWNISGTDTGSVTGVNTFSNIQTLIGGSAADTFNLNGNMSGAVFGEAGADIFNFNSSQGASFFGDAGNDTFNILSSGLAVTLNGGADSDQLLAADANNQWDINGNALGDLYQAATSNSKVEFSGIESLQGGSGTDSFKLAASAVIGSIAGGAGENSLQGADKNNTWTISSNNGGTILGVATFSEIQTLIGGALVDTFHLNADTSGTVSGRAGNDVFNISRTQSALLLGEAGQDTFNILAADLNADINGGADKDLLVAHNVENQWDILGGESGELYQGSQGDKVSFSNVESLQGGEAKDNFTLSDNGSITHIDGGAGTNSLTGKNGNNTWNIDTSNGGSVNYVAAFSNIQNLYGGSAVDDFRLGASGEVRNIDGGEGDNRLKARDGVTNTWNISSANAGSVSNVAGFSNIQSIVGGTGIDEITFSQDGYVESLIDGGGGLDSLDILKLTSNISILLTKELSSTPDTLNVVNVETIQANTNKNNTLFGANAANTWIISGTNSGSVAPTNNAEIDNTTRFSGFANILGGNLDDTFVIISAGKITGEIDGGGHQNSDVVDYSQQANVTVNLGLVFNVEKFRGNNKNITLAGGDNNNIWEITGLNSGTLTEGGNTISFEDFNLLKGGADTDTFNVAGGGSIGTLINGEIVGEIDGADGDDTLNVTLTGSEQGQINFIGGGENAGDRINISGGSESYTTTYSINNNDHAQLDYLNNDNGNTFTLRYQGSEEINDTLVAQSLVIAGGANDDAILLATNIFSVNNLAAVSYANKNALVVNGGGGSDSIDVAGAINMPGKNVFLSAETLSNTSDGLINASNLYLEDVDTAGSDTARINTNIENLHIINSSNVYIDELNGINIAELDQADNIYISADSIADTAALVNDGTLSLNARSGDIVLDADNRLSGLLNLSAFGHIDINNLTSTELGSVTANNLTLNSAGDIFGQGAVNVRQNTLFQSPGADINLRGANDFSRLEIISANSVSVNDVNTLLLENSQADVAINIVANGLQANNVSAGALVNLSAGSGHLAGSGLVAPRIELRATTGIGKGQAPVTTRTDTLFVENGTNQINIDNTGVVTLERLKNTGDITFNNDADIYVKPGSIDAGFNSGTLFLKTETGSFLGLGEANPNNPDITAYAGIFFGLQGTFGTIKRPLVLNVQDSVLINSRSSLNPIFYPSQPRTVDDRSLLQFNAFDALSTLSGGQLVELETLAEINPAIFTDVRNYASAEIAIRLPRDQLYADELEEYEE